MKFELVSNYKPKGDQPKAISSLVSGIRQESKHQVLLGVTGSGKTFTMANIIAQIQKPTLVIAHNKTLAAQLFSEFKELFPKNAVEYFISYYDYYQPEAYIPKTDIYIEKDSSINEEIDKMRHSATYSVMERRDIVIVASVSCIYGIGAPEDYHEMMLWLEKGMKIERESILSRLIEIQYQRNDIDFYRGTFRVRGDRIDVFPAYTGDKAIRIELFGDEIESLTEIDPLRGRTQNRMKKLAIYPGSHYVVSKDRMKQAVYKIREELSGQINYFEQQKKFIEAQRIKERTLFDLEMMEELGYCNGIENYSRHLTGRKEGEPSYTLMDYLPKDFLLFVDESHVTVPQLNGMYKGDYSRKKTLVEYGFRLPSALDNRPLTFEEFEKKVSQVIYVSATPAEYELKKSNGKIIEQIIRPTGLADPEIILRSAKRQVDDLLDEIKKRIEKKERILVTTLTKRMAEDLTEYYVDLGIKVKYLHSEIDSLERVEIIKDLRLGKFDVLIGINLLREGLDIPEVTLVAILDADKEGFLRSERSLIQTCGRAARNVDGKVIMYAEHLTSAIESTVLETNRRRKLQIDYNKKHNITPKSIQKSIHNIMESIYEMDYYTVSIKEGKKDKEIGPKEIPKHIKKLKNDMKKAAKLLEYERAAAIRDRIFTLEKKLLEF
ncbi:MAG: excinuclease ABC subunit UvrB [Thermodesulfobacteriota bacterium]|nr:excinuclease ABC subunit UvrB [Thermodesulfobacteriota bacterium]